MVRKALLCLSISALLAVPAVASSHEEETPSPPFIYGTYSQCDLDAQWIADMIVESKFAPSYNAAVEEGSILGWGYLAHHTGGKWRRVIYHVAPTTDALLDTLTSINDDIAAKHPEAGPKYSEICGSHEDYIWRYGTGSGDMVESLEARAGASMSVYFDCDTTREERADELVETVFAPVYNAHVGEGKLTNWAWFQHWVGGKWRRLLSTSAADAKTLLNVRTELIAALDEAHGEAFAEFDAICGSHDDYLWEIVVDKP